MELPPYDQLSDTSSVCDPKQPLSADEKEERDLSLPTSGAIKLIKTSHGSMTTSCIKAQQSNDILYSLKRTSVKSLEVYRGDFLAASQGSCLDNNGDSAPQLLATVGTFSIEYVDPGTRTKVKIPESSFLYTKRWYNIDRYFKVNGVEYKLGGAHFVGCNVYLTCADDAEGSEPLAVLQPSLSPSIQRVFTINAHAMYWGPDETQPVNCLLANGKPTVLLDKLLLADHIFR